MPLVLPGSGKLRSLSLNKMLPNLVTLLALSAGLTSLRYGLRGEFEHAVFALFLAAIFDALDGRVARKLKSSSKFGAELDSLSDVVSFGVTPAVLLYMWTMLHAGGIGWAVCVIFTLCMALRLARFNTMLGDPDLPAYMHSYFTGVPAPAAALLGIFPMVLSFQFGELPFKPVACGTLYAGNFFFDGMQAPDIFDEEISYSSTVGATVYDWNWSVGRPLGDGSMDDTQCCWACVPGEYTVCICLCFTSRKTRTQESEIGKRDGRSF